jgi:hypothetical protein
MEFITFWDIWDSIFKSKAIKETWAEKNWNSLVITDIHTANMIINQYKYSNPTVTKDKYFEAKTKFIFYKFHKQIGNGIITIPSDTTGKICQYFIRQGMDYEKIHNFLIGNVGQYFFDELASNIYSVTSSQFNSHTQGTKTFVIDIDKVVQDSLIDANKMYRFDRMKKHEAQSIIQKMLFKDTVTTGDAIEYVYCIGDDSDKHNKIGKSNNPSERLKQLQTGNPTQLYLKYSAKVNNSKFAEEELHSLFVSQNVIINGNKEWFEVPSWKIINEIRKYENTS